MPEVLARGLGLTYAATGRETRTNCGVIGFGDEVRVTFGRNVKSHEVERLFFTKLIRLGVPVRIQER